MNIEGFSYETKTFLRQQLTLYNSLTRREEKFVPHSEDDRVGMYSCGPTVYKDAHIGNHRANVFADVLRRTLIQAGYIVTHVINITDVGHLVSDSDQGEDKLAKEAAQQRVTAWEIAAKYTALWIGDLEKLNILPPTVLPKATEHIPEQIALVQVLEKKGYTYRTKDGIYFDTSMVKHYGQLSDLDLANLQAGKRVEMGEKKNPTDFALWKFAEEGVVRDMEWDSPWGKGFPGWHIECSAMAMKYLGAHFDIHTGGIDLKQTHHPNEIVQSECATGNTPYVNYWMHSAYLTLVQRDPDTKAMVPVKMSKSLGNVITVDSLEKQGIAPMALRYLYLSAKYRQNLEVSAESLDNAQRSYDSLKNTIARSVQDPGTDIRERYSINAKNLEQKFIATLANDLNTPMALAILWETIKTDDAIVSPQEKYSLLHGYDLILALNLLQFANESQQDIPKELMDLAELRALAKKEKDWKKADELREQIENLGYSIKDTKSGYTLQKKI